MSEQPLPSPEPLRIMRPQAERIAKQIIKQEARLMDPEKKKKLDLEPELTEFQAKSILEGIHKKANKRGWQVYGEESLFNTKKVKVKVNPRFMFIVTSQEVYEEINDILPA